MNTQNTQKFKTIDDFKEVSVKSYKELTLGSRFFEGSTSIEIISEVYRDPQNNFLWVDVRVTYEDGWNTVSSESLADNNITNGGYNPWMWFKDPEIAKEHKNRDWVEAEEEDCFGDRTCIFSTPSWCETLTEKEIRRFPVKETLLFREE